MIGLYLLVNRFLMLPRLQLLHGLGFRDVEPAVRIVDTYLDDANCTLTSHNYCQQPKRTG